MLQFPCAPLNLVLTDQCEQVTANDQTSTPLLLRNTRAPSPVILCKDKPHT